MIPPRRLSIILCLCVNCPPAAQLSRMPMWMSQGVFHKLARPPASRCPCLAQSRNPLGRCRACAKPPRRQEARSWEPGARVYTHSLSTPGAAAPRTEALWEREALGRGVGAAGLPRTLQTHQIIASAAPPPRARPRSSFQPEN